MKIIFMGTPEFAIPALYSLIEFHDVVAVYSQPPRPKGRGLHEQKSPVHLLADERSISVYTPSSLKSEIEQEKFRAIKADLAVVVAYGLILPQAILDATKYGCINIHPSALPRWRGAAPIQRTIMAGDKTTEICIMQMDSGLDTGDIIIRKSYDIAPQTTAGTLHDFLAEQAPKLLIEAIRQIENSTAKRKKQSEKGISYAEKISKEETKLDFSKSAEEVLQQILGLSLHPGAWFEYNGERIKIFNASLTEKNNFPLACNPGIIYPTDLQKSGGKRMNINDFLLGIRPFSKI